MKKMMLDLDELEVESFDTSERGPDGSLAAWSDDSVCPTVTSNRCY
jgi:hypothetical protein